MNQDLAEVPLQRDLPSPSPSALARRLDQCAFLLDIDGTLLDLAPTPREVGCRRVSPKPSTGS